ncbi:translation elongation factor Ts [Pavlovales sp. CCMP2436]|nr:translation elongation factor Ts [Pavlovales sp. CCMP2436]|mmetsp:Transcript_35813/g.84191  ORF Transcript_35813/g.84191 Transcript_35813/m.84191 type:complete len:233 (-) Transcript_35813:127-825(-)
MLALAVAAALAFAPMTPMVSRRSFVAVPCVRMAEVAIAAADVKTLRQKTGAGMMDCKGALKECGGNMEAAADMLRSKGLAAAGKRADKATSEGIIEVYIHTGARLGVMVEVNCETDFVAKRPEFAELAKAVAMQIAASPTVEFISVEDIPEEVREKERVAEMASEDLAGKNDEIKAKMVDGRLQKILKTKCLMEQPYIKDPSQTISDLVKSKISTLGENIQIRKFSRMELGN